MAATITSNTFDLRSGSGTIAIYSPNIAASYDGLTMDAVEIDDLSGDFDVEEDSDDAKSVLFGLGDFSFTAFDRLSDGKSLFEGLDALASTEFVEVTLDFTLNSGRRFVDVYTFTIEDMEYDRTKRETSIEGAQRITDPLKNNITDLFDNATSGTARGDVAFDTGDDNIDPFDITGNGIKDNDCVDARTFLVKCLELLNPDANATDVLSSSNFSFNGRTQTSTSGDVYILVDDGAADAVKISDLMLEMAACEGAVIGSILGYNFYVDRESTTSAVTISQSDVLADSLTIKAGINAYAGIDVSFIGNSGNFSSWTSYSRITSLDETLTESDTNITVGSSSGISVDEVILIDQELMLVTATGTGNIDVIRGYKSIASAHDTGSNIQRTYNPDASKTLNVLFRNKNLAWAYYDTTSSQYKDAGGSTNNVASDGRTGYANAYGANKARKIELTILGVETINPYQAITLDSSFPSLIAGQTYRPSEISYNLKEDKAEIKAYKIA